MYFRAIKQLETRDHRGRIVTINPGQLVDIAMQHEVDRLLRLGAIIQPEYSIKSGNGIATPADPLSPVRRIGIWLHTSRWYSGGRIHMYQIACALACNGCDVLMVTDGMPMWSKDYPEFPRLRILIEGEDDIPNDLDVIMTDSKDSLGMRARAWRDQHAPWAAFVGFNFETPNWITEGHPFCTDPVCVQYGKNLEEHVHKDIFNHADMILANSEESKRWMQKWFVDAHPQHWGVIRPAVNTFGMTEIKPWTNPTGHPYVVWSGRSPAYKGGDVAIEAVMSCPHALDLVMFGQPQNRPTPTDLHRVHVLQDQSDNAKFATMAGAVLTLAPSKFEGYGMVPGESLCCGTPVIAYDLPVLREEYKPWIGDGLTLTPWADRDAFAKAVHTLTASPKASVNVDFARRSHGMGAACLEVERTPHLSMRTKRLSVHMIAYWGFMPESVESVYPFADEIVVAFGRDKSAAADIDDGSYDRLMSIPDPDKKITVKRQVWDDKLHMRSWCASRLVGNWHLLLDGDEVWVGLDKWLENDMYFGCPRWVNFWHGTKHWIHSYPDREKERWGQPLDPFGSICPHYRISWWRRSYKFRTHPLPVDMHDTPLHNPRATQAEFVPEAVIYHFGHALPRHIMDAKHRYYGDRDGWDEGRKRRMKAWHDWQNAMGDCGDGIIKPVDWDLPDIVKRAEKGLKSWVL